MVINLQSLDNFAKVTQPVFDRLIQLSSTQLYPYLKSTLLTHSMTS